MDAQQKRSLKIIFFTVFLDLVGFGMILPLIPYLGGDLGATPVQIGWLMATFSIMQFIFAPMWGRLSDRFGRRPIILTSLFGATFAYLFFAFAKGLTFLFIARALAGFFAANISAAQAYIADITPKDKRSASMGLIGAAFGLGFIFGPVIAGGAVHVADMFVEQLGSAPPFGKQFAAFVAAILNAINFVLAFFMLPETITNPGARDRKKYGRLESFTFVFKNPLLRSMFGIFLMMNLAMALMEVMVFPFVEDRFNWDYRLATFSFAYVGVIMVITQGYFIRKWVPKFGEKKVLMFGLLAMTLSFVGIGLSFSIPVLAVMMTILAVGNGCVRPPIVGLASVIADEEQQGYVLGVMASIGSMGRIFGPILGGWLYQEISQGAPFFGSGVMGAIGVVLFLLIVKTLPNPQAAKAA